MIRALLLYLIISTSTHDFHFTKTVFNWNPESETLETVVNIFTDDLERAIESVENIDLEIGADNQHIDTDSLVALYALTHIQVSTPTEKLNFTWVGLEYDYDITYLYLESEPINLDSNLILSVSLLNEIYFDEENVITLKTPEGETTEMLTTSKIEVNINP